MSRSSLRRSADFSSSQDQQCGRRIINRSGEMLGEPRQRRVQNVKLAARLTQAARDRDRVRRRAVLLDVEIVHEVDGHHDTDRG